MSIEGLWRLYECDDPWFLRFASAVVELVGDEQERQIREAKDG